MRRMDSTDPDATPTIEDLHALAAGLRDLELTELPTAADALVDALELLLDGEDG
ncbi:MAG: hypothetical protein KatS3mg011_1940 [Acidimicrobiia bacterium]|nr:MAG: hypothetical protein KatS3mg011_1940 [Acidimicrobiia bacterium]